MVDDMKNVFSEIVAFVGDAFPGIAILDVFTHNNTSFIWYFYYTLF